MSTLRDNLLSVVDSLRKMPSDFGLRRYAVTLRRRVWQGTRVGDTTGGPPVNQDIVIAPAPKVRFRSPFAAQMAAIMAAGGTIRDRYYQIDKITPQFTRADGSLGGYTPQQLRMRPGSDEQNVECVVVLIGDDGMLRECTQVLLEDDRAFGYSMLCQETDKPSVALTSIAITPSPAALVRPATLQFVATGTFEDGTTADVTSLCKWTSASPSVATIDLLGKATGASAGTSAIGASILGIAAPAVTLTVT